MGKIIQTNVIGSDILERFHEELANTIREMQNGEDLEVEIQYSYSHSPVYGRRYSALVIGREREV